MTYRQPFEGDWPITQKYGDTITSSFHTGIDYGCPEGTPILASNDGIVMVAKTDQSSNGGYGKYVIIQHSDGKSTLYGHLKHFIVSPNQKVKQSEIIGYSGNTGNSTGPHLHFEARRIWHDYRSYFDPMDLPLMSMYQPAIQPDYLITKETTKFKEANELESNIKVVAPYGVRAFDENFNWKQNFPCGTELIFTGETKIRDDNGLTYCKVYPYYRPFWVAVHDKDTQILDNNNSQN